MKNQLLTRVQEAEAIAADTIATAEEAAKTTVSAARKAAEAQVAEEKARSDAAYQERLAAAREEGAAEANKILAKGKRQATNLSKRFETGLDGTVDRVRALFEESL